MVFEKRPFSSVVPTNAIKRRFKNPQCVDGRGPLRIDWDLFRDGLAHDWLSASVFDHWPIRMLGLFSPLAFEYLSSALLFLKTASLSYHSSGRESFSCMQLRYMITDPVSKNHWRILLTSAWFRTIFITTFCFICGLHGFAIVFFAVAFPFDV